MKRFHTHLAVNDLQASIDFYSKLFGQPPSKRENDYAKWMLDDPRINFAISARGHAVGVNHFGFQVDTPDELAALKQLAATASHQSFICNRRASVSQRRIGQKMSRRNFLQCNNLPITEFISTN